MHIFEKVTNLPEVKSAFLSDTNGSLIDSFNDPEAEMGASVFAFSISHLSEVGNEFGLGELKQFHLKEKHESSIIYINDEFILSTKVNSSKITSSEANIKKIIEEAE